MRGLHEGLPKPSSNPCEVLTLGAGVGRSSACGVCRLVVGVARPQAAGVFSRPPSLLHTGRNRHAALRFLPVRGAIPSGVPHLLHVFLDKGGAKVGCGTPPPLPVGVVLFVKLLGGGLKTISIAGSGGGIVVVFGSFIIGLARNSNYAYGIYVLYWFELRDATRCAIASLVLVVGGVFRSSRRLFTPSRASSSRRRLPSSPCSPSRGWVGGT